MAILVGAQAVVTSGNATAAFPAGYTPTAGDFAFVMLGAKGDTLSVDNSPAADNGGLWPKRAAAFRTTGAAQAIATYSRVLEGGESAPAFAIPADWDGTGNGMSAQMVVVEAATFDVDSGTPFDATETTNEGAASPFNPAAFTTATDGALVFSLIMTNDDNALALDTANGFTGLATGGAYDTTTGGDHSIGIAYLEQATAGPVTMCTWAQTVNGVDGVVTMTMALRKAGGGGGGAVVDPGYYRRASVGYHHR